MSITLLSQPTVLYQPSGPDNSGRSGDRLTSTSGRREQDLTFSEGTTGEQLQGMYSGGSTKPPEIETPKLRGNSAVSIERAMKALASSSEILLNSNQATIDSKGIIADQQGKAAVARMNEAIREAPHRSPDLLGWLGNFFVQIGVQVGSAFVKAVTTGDWIGFAACAAGALIGGIASGLYEFVLKPFVEGPLVNFLVDAGIMNRAEAQVFANTLVLGTLCALTITATAAASIALVVFAGAPPTVVLGALQGVTAGLSAGVVSPGLVKSLVSLSAGVAGAAATGGLSLSGNAADITGGIIKSFGSGSLKSLGDSIIDEEFWKQASLLVSGFAQAGAAAINGMGALCKATLGDSTELDAIKQNVDGAMAKQDDYYSNQWKASGDNLEGAGNTIEAGVDAVAEWGEDAISWASGRSIQFA